MIFIGGAWDGRRENVNPVLPFMRVPVADAEFHYFDRDEVPLRTTFKTETYRLSRIRTTETEYQFYVKDGMTDDNAISLLFKNYAP